MTSTIHVWHDVVGHCHLRLTSCCRHTAPGQDLIPLQRLLVFAHSRDPYPAIKLWCRVPFTKSKTIFQIEMYCLQCFLKSKYIKIRTFNDKNQWIIKKVMVLKKLLPHLATRGTYSSGDWRCDEAWHEQKLVYPPVMCQQRLIYCTWELNVMERFNLLFIVILTRYGTRQKSRLKLWEVFLWLASLKVDLYFQSWSKCTGHS